MSFLTPSHFFDLSSFEHSALFQDCQFVWQALQRLEQYLASKKLGQIEVSTDGAYLINPELISIGAGTVIEPGAYIKGPCIIGKNCQIRHGAYIRGDCIVGDRSVVGHTTEMKHSILLNNAHAAHFAYVGDSILGNSVNLGAGVKCANLRLKKDEVIVRYNDQKFKTGLRKFGAIIGDESQVGCNAVLNPGTLISKQVECYPLTCVGGFIEEKSRIKNKGVS
jgi:NDP-sugar pyrophosphorylase family protein